MPIIPFYLIVPIVNLINQLNEDKKLKFIVKNIKFPNIVKSLKLLKTNIKRSNKKKI